MAHDQKLLGIHYTREDISEYIAKNTIIAFLFDATKKKYPAAFEPNGAVWRLLRENPDCYMYEALRCEHYLSMETEREYQARRRRYVHLKARLLAGEIGSIEDLITHNLDIGRFALDVIGRCEEQDLLRAFYESLEQVSILDPACGSGAFLLAAFKVLEPLYTGCLEKMEGRRNCRYFIAKSIICNNLFGVDIMEEAVEVCKRCLYAKVMEGIWDGEDSEVFRELDKHIRVGNVLVGFVSRGYYPPLRQGSPPYPVDSIHRAPCLAWSAAQGLRPMCSFFAHRARDQRLRPCIWGMHSKAGAAQNRGHVSNDRYPMTSSELDCTLAAQYDIDPQDGKNFAEWRDSHRPLHWGVEFEQVMCKGGFDVIIGNPPYVEYSKVDYRLPADAYKTVSCGNLYAFCMERSIELLQDEGRWGMIVPLSGFSTARMHKLQEFVMEHSSCLHVCFLSGDANPSKLFEGVKFRLCIGLAKKGQDRFTYYSTRYIRWYAQERETLFRLFQYCESTDAMMKGSLPKVGQEIEMALLSKISGQTALRSFVGHGDYPLYYNTCPVNWMRATTFVPRFSSDRDGVKLSSQIRQLTFQSEEWRDAAVCLLNSTLFFWFWLIYSDCYHLTEREMGGFPVNLNELARQQGGHLSNLSTDLMSDYKKHSRERTYVYKTTGRVIYDEFYPKLSKPIIDEIDRVLALYYGFNAEELEFILNYEMKYRMGIPGLRK